MNNIEIKINKKSKMVDLSKTFLGNEGESLQGKLIFSFDEFIEGQARLEFEIDGKTDMIFLERVGETYQAPILSKLTKKGQIDMQLVITEGTSEDEVAIFKSNVFYIYCNYSINAESEQPEEYPSWIEIANTKLNQFENVIQIIETEGTGKRFLSDDGTYKEVSGTTGGTRDYEKLDNQPSINDVTLIGNKTLDELGIQAKGDYAKKSDIPTKTSQLTNDSDFLTSIPSEYITEAELNAKGYLTQHQDISHLATKSEVKDKASITDMINYIESHKDELKGEKGEDGIDGKDGVDGTNGKDGYTPIKGTDYYTEADKQEMVNSVINALPKYNGGVS